MATFGSLFAGIGGIDLGLERAGWTGRWQVENDPYATRVLEKHWPDVPRYGDIRAIDWTGVERVDLVAGGFPCQPVSSAGVRRAQDDARWLWQEFYRAVRVLRPNLVLVENVPGLLYRGIGDVLGDLAAIGYDAEWDCIPAAAIGAPHLRDRVWIVAYPDGLAEPQEPSRDAALGGERSAGPRRSVEPTGLGAGGGVGVRHHPARVRGRRTGSPPRTRPTLLDDANGGRRQSGSQRSSFWRLPKPDPRRHGSGDGWWSAEPDVGRVVTGLPSRVDRLRGLGNAVVPQVVEWIGHRLRSFLEDDDVRGWA